MTDLPLAISCWFILRRVWIVLKVVSLGEAYLLATVVPSRSRSTTQWLKSADVKENRRKKYAVFVE